MRLGGRREGEQGLTNLQALFVGAGRREELIKQRLQLRKNTGVCLQSGRERRARSVRGGSRQH